MPDKIIQDQVRRLNESWQPLNRVYDEYARSLDMSPASFDVLCYINYRGTCTQKDISQHQRIPKQTVNSIITSFYKEGLVVLEEQEEDRRSKTVSLTEKGKKYAQEARCNIKKAEYASMEQFTPEEREQLIEFMKRYANKCLEIVIEDLGNKKRGEEE